MKKNKFQNVNWKNYWKVGSRDKLRLRLRLSDIEFPERLSERFRPFWYFKRGEIKKNHLSTQYQSEKPGLSKKREEHWCKLYFDFLKILRSWQRWRETRDIRWRQQMNPFSLETVFSQTGGKSVTKFPWSRLLSTHCYTAKNGFLYTQHTYTAKNGLQYSENWRQHRCILELKQMYVYGKENVSPLYSKSKCRSML